MRMGTTYSPCAWIWILLSIPLATGGTGATNNDIHFAAQTAPMLSVMCHGKDLKVTNNIRIQAIQLNVTTTSYLSNGDSKNWLFKIKADNTLQRKLNSTTMTAYGYIEANNTKSSFLYMMKIAEGNDEEHRSKFTCIFHTVHNVNEEMGTEEFETSVSKVNYTKLSCTLGLAAKIAYIVRESSLGAVFITPDGTDQTGAYLTAYNSTDGIVTYLLNVTSESVKLTAYVPPVNNSKTTYVCRVSATKQFSKSLVIPQPTGVTEALSLEDGKVTVVVIGIMAAVVVVAVVIGVAYYCFRRHRYRGQQSNSEMQGERPNRQDTAQDLHDNVSGESFNSQDEAEECRDNAPSEKLLTNTEMNEV